MRRTGAPHAKKCDASRGSGDPPGARLSEADDLDHAHEDHPNGLTLEQTIEEIRTSDSFIMVRSPENDPSFREFFADLAGDVRALLPAWRPEAQPLASRFRFAAGDALHIPFLAGHYVRNGPDDVSISMSIIFNTDGSVRWTRALLFNRRAPPLLARLGAQPVPVGVSRGGTP